MSFGSNLERIRKEKKISQTTLGEELGLTQQMISSYEKGTSSPNVELLIKVADYFGVSIDSLVGHVVKTPDINTSGARFLRYFESLGDSDREKCIMIAQTLVQDREINHTQNPKKQEA